MSGREDGIIELGAPVDGKLGFLPIGLITEEDFREWKRKVLLLAIVIQLVSLVACAFIGEYVASPLGLILSIIVGMVLFIPSFYVGMRAVINRTITVINL